MLAQKPDIRSCERAFKVADSEGKHKLDAAAIKKGFDYLEMTLGDEQLKQILEIVDQDNDGLITIQEFIHFVYICQNISDPHDVKNLLFLAADCDCSGTINKNELGMILKKLGAEVTPKLL